MRIFLFILILFNILSCKDKGSIIVKSKKSTIEKKFEIKADSLNEEFLSRAVYDTAIFYNNSPSSSGEFLLNEKKLFFFYAGLGNVFTKEEKQKPIPIKEVTWNLDEINLITVFYAKRKLVFEPVEVFIHNRTMEY